MNTLESIREALPGYARDLQLNLGSVLTPAGPSRSPPLSPRVTQTSAGGCRRSRRSTWMPHT